MLMIPKISLFIIVVIKVRNQRAYPAVCGSQTAFRDDPLIPDE
jgi:hypothetical protein